MPAAPAVTKPESSKSFRVVAYPLSSLLLRLDVPVAGHSGYSGILRCLSSGFESEQALRQRRRLATVNQKARHLCSHAAPISPTIRDPRHPPTARRCSRKQCRQPEVAPEKGGLPGVGEQDRLRNAKKLNAAGEKPIQSRSTGPPSAPRVNPRTNADAGRGCAGNDPRSRAHWWQAGDQAPKAPAAEKTHGIEVSKPIWMVDSSPYVPMRSAARQKAQSRGLRDLVGEVDRS